MGTGQSSLFGDPSLARPGPKASPKPKHRLIIGIDIGVTSTAVVVCLLKPDFPVTPYCVSNWPGQNAENLAFTTPSIVLYDGQTKIQAGFGALQPYANEAPDNSSIYRARNFKLQLYHPLGDSDTGFPPEDLPHLPTSLNILNVYIDFLSYILEPTKHCVARLFGEDVWTEYENDRDIVMTHPKLWGAAQRQVLLNAAVLSGWISEPRSRTNFFLVDETWAAARYCVGQRVAGFEELKAGSQITLCDTGEWTIDMTTYEIQHLSPIPILREVRSTCLSMGHVRAESAFEAYLSTRWQSTIDDKARYTLISRAVQDFAERAKRKFKDPALPFFVQVGPPTLWDHALNIYQGRIEVPGAMMENFFRPAVDRITNRLSAELRMLDPPAQCVILTGEFGACPYLKRRFRELYSGTVVQFDEFGSSNPIAFGAALLGVNGKLIPGNIGAPAWMEVINSLADRTIAPTYFDMWGCIVTNLRGSPATEAVDALYKQLEGPLPSSSRGPALKLLHELCSSNEVLPTSLRLTDVKLTHDLIGQGGEAVVTIGSFEGGKVAIRRLVPLPSGDRGGPPGHLIRKIIAREVLIQSQLRHRNILRLLGVFQLKQGDQIMMVLPYISGQVVPYIEENPNKLKYIMLGISEGVAYLHSQDPPIIHGDLHPDNILVDIDSGDAILCDFGLSRVRHEFSRSTTIIRPGGHPRYLAPELVNADAIRAVEATDVFSLAFVFYTLATRLSPLDNIENERKVSRLIGLGQRPLRPESLGVLTTKEGEEVWRFLEMMWSQSACHRPSARDVVERLKDIFG